MHINRQTARFVVPVAALLLGGCFKLSRESPPLRQYVLSASEQFPALRDDQGSSATRKGSRPEFTIGLRQTDIAAYLSSRHIIVRSGASEVMTSEFHRWSEDVSQGINRVVAANLASAGRISDVDIAPWPISARHTFLLQLHVRRFEGITDSLAQERSRLQEGSRSALKTDSLTSTGFIRMTADWEIIRPRDGRVLLRGSTDVRDDSWRAGDYPGLVRGLDAGLAQLAQDINACLSRFSNDSTPPVSAAGCVGSR